MRIEQHLSDAELRRHIRDAISDRFKLDDCILITAGQASRMLDQPRVWLKEVLPEVVLPPNRRRYRLSDIRALIAASLRDPAPRKYAPKKLPPVIIARKNAAKETNDILKP